MVSVCFSRISGSVSAFASDDKSPLDHETQAVFVLSLSVQVNRSGHEAGELFPTPGWLKFSVE